MPDKKRKKEKKKKPFSYINSEKIKNKFRLIAKDYSFLWEDKFGNLRWNSIYGHKFRFVFKTKVVSVEIFKPCNHPSRTNNINPAKYWYRISSYTYVHTSEDQWINALKFISYQYE